MTTFSCFLLRLASNMYTQSLPFLQRLFFLGGVFLCLSLLSVSSSAIENSYRLSTGDRIQITVYGEKDLSMETTLNSIGVISYPFLGDITVSGMTVKKLESYIHDHLKDDYLVNPNVHVSIVTYRFFYVNGQVKSPGGYAYRPGLTVQRAISLAGGYTERASRKNTFILHEEDSEKRIQVKQNTKVRPGDIITVEESFF